MPSPVGRYHIQTWGCQMNVHDSEKLAGLLEGQGYTRAEDESRADVILLNTCSIREKAAEKVFSELGRLQWLKRRNPGLLIGVCGCVAQQEKERIFERAPDVDFVVGPRATGSLPSTLSRLRAGDPAGRRSVDTAYRDDSIRFPFDSIRRTGEATGKAFITVIEGCNHRCTYCIVPITRGREICRPMDEIVAEARRLVLRGIVEIEFLGQTVNAYRDAEGRTLADLLLAASAIDGLGRIRFTTSHPAQMTDRLMDAMAGARPAVCPYLHLPVQSGSSAVLRRMRRGYDRDGYLEKIRGLRRRMPDLAFGTDIIVGFPGETEADFEQTMSLLEEVGYDTVYSFVYSERPGTASARMADEVPMRVKLERLQALQARQKQIQEERNRRWVGRAAEVLVEGPSKRDPGKRTGRTADNRVVNFSGSHPAGSLQTVEIVDTTAFSLTGRALESVA